MQTAEEFLARRGVEESVIRTLTEEKIDCEAITVMSDEELAKYIPAYGDRVALFAFARCILKRQETTEETVASSPSEEVFRPKGKRGANYLNQNARRRQRRIDMGWMNYNTFHHSFRQVRSQNGGGTRGLTLDRNTTITDLKAATIAKFFPNSISKLGHLEDFETEIRDFKGEEILPDTTIEDLHQVSKLKTLKAYLYTKKKNDNPAKITIPNQETTQTDEESSVVTPTVTLDCTDSQINQSPSSDWLSSGTPEVTFRRRNRLSLTWSSTAPSSSSGSWRERLHSPVINITDRSDDEELEEQLLKQAVEESLSEIAGTPQENSKKSTEEILLELGGAVDRTKKKNLINVTRENVIEGVIRGFQRRTFDAQAELHVKFGGEDGIDDGGLTRECMRLLKKQIYQHQIFCGNDNSKQLALHTTALNKGVYKIVGQIIAYMLVHRGPVPNFLDPFLYDMLSQGVDSVRPQISNVVEYDLQNQLQKIADSTDASTFFNAVEPLECLIRVSGNASFVGNIGRKDELVKALCQFLVVENMKPAYAQFAEGLKTLGVLDALQRHGDSLKELFVYTEKPLTSDVIDRLYTPSFSSPDGSNRKRKEDATMTWWRDFILNMEEEGNLQSLLAFLTGLDEIPPLGFECNGYILFRHKEDMDPNDATVAFPLINTCSLELRLPVLDSFELFVERFTAAMEVNTFTAI